jgi:hypothetical protein
VTRKKLAGLWREKVAQTDPSDEKSPHYIISDRPMTEEEWEREALAHGPRGTRPPPGACADCGPRGSGFLAANLERVADRRIQVWRESRLGRP